MSDFEEHVRNTRRLAALCAPFSFGGGGALDQANRRSILEDAVNGIIECLWSLIEGMIPSYHMSGAAHHDDIGALLNDVHRLYSEDPYAWEVGAVVRYHGRDLRHQLMINDDDVRLAATTLAYVEGWAKVMLIRQQYLDALGNLASLDLDLYFMD